MVVDRSVVLVQLQGRLRADEKIIGEGRDNTLHLYNALELSNYIDIHYSMLR